MRRVGAVVLLLALFASTSASAFAFEFNRTENGTPIRWNASRPICWQVADGAPEGLRTALLAALTQWSEASGGALQFVEASGRGITLTYNRGSTLKHAMAYTNCEVVSGEILSATIELNANDYAWETTYAQFLAPALLHETGHALGLEHAAADGTHVIGAFRAEDPPTMSPTLTLCARTLHYDDIIGLRTLYGVETDSVARTFVITEKHRGKVYTFTASGAPGDVYWNYGDGSDDASGTHRYPRGGYNVQAQSRGFVGDLFIQIGPVKTAAQRNPNKK